jgi:hypothetical protein
MSGKPRREQFVARRIEDNRLNRQVVEHTKNARADAAAELENVPEALHGQHAGFPQMTYLIEQVKRLIGTIMGRVHFYTATTFANPTARQDNGSARFSAMTFREFECALGREIAGRFDSTGIDFADSV